jgi:hypothetical protein
MKMIDLSNLKLPVCTASAVIPGEEKNKVSPGHLSKTENSMSI